MGVAYCLMVRQAGPNSKEKHAEGTGQVWCENWLKVSITFVRLSLAEQK